MLRKFKIFDWKFCFIFNLKEKMKKNLKNHKTRKLKSYEDHNDCVIMCSSRNCVKANMQQTLNHPHCTIVSAFPVCRKCLPCISPYCSLIQDTRFGGVLPASTFELHYVLLLIVRCSLVHSFVHQFPSICAFPSISPLFYFHFKPPIYFLSRFSYSKSNLRLLILRDIYAAFVSRDASNRNADDVS